MKHSTWLWQSIWILCVWLWHVQAAPLPQSAMDKLTLGAMNVFGTAADILGNGARAHKEGGFDAGLFSSNGAMDIGFGNAMRPVEEDSSEERKKRAVNTLEESKPVIAAPIEEAPCAGGTNQNAGNDAAVDELQRRQRRARAQKQRKANQQKRSGSQKKFNDSDRRRRRQAEYPDLDADGSGVGQQIGANAKQFGEQIRSAVESFVKTMKQVVEQVRQTFAGGNMKQPGTAEP